MAGFSSVLDVRGLSRIIDVFDVLLGDVLPVFRCFRRILEILAEFKILKRFWMS